VRARKMVLGGLMVVLVLGLVGCGSDSKDNSVLGGSSKAADLVVSDNYPFYSPTDLTVPQNKEVTFTVFNDGKKTHNITVPGFAIDMDVEPGQTISVKVPATGAPRDGFFTMYCKYHQSQGEATKLKIAG
jgi:plastocyanin